MGVYFFPFVENGRTQSPQIVSDRQCLVVELALVVTMLFDPSSQSALSQFLLVPIACSHLIQAIIKGKWY